MNDFLITNYLILDLVIFSFIHAFISMLFAFGIKLMEWKNGP